MSSFPPDPSDGMIAEVAPGLFYQFSKDENTWIRVDGFDALGLATISSDGLMAKEDLRKLNGLLVPPPRITLTSEDCSFTFDSGTFGFRSSKEHLFIDHELELLNNNGDSIVVDKQAWEIHENTFGYNFRVNVEELVLEMQSRGNLGFRRTVGAQGDKGAKGIDGEDDLDTGPIGEIGANGANFPFSGALTRESSGDFEVAEENRAIVDIKTGVSGDENFLVLTRANIGNLDACPAELRPKDFESPFVVVIDDNTIRAQTLKTQINDDCQVTCSICSGVFHVDMQSLVDQVFNRFKELALELKEAKEELANSWLTTMINSFNQQRDAICCALENCESRKRNQDERRFIESQRVQAAQGDFQLKIDGEEDKVVIDFQADKQCPGVGGSVIFGDPCPECQVEMIIDGILNAGSIASSVETDLPAGEYIAEVEDCCISFIGNQFNGRIRFKYISTSGEDKEITVPDLGTFTTNEAAKNAYIGQKFAFVHNGGSVAAWFPDSFPDDNSGSLTLCVKPSSCFEFSTDLGGTSGAPVPESCQMEASQLDWYERGWRIGACCGAHMIAGGQQFIVVKRSIGIDLTCGGGESLSTECISKFIDAGSGHPAIAFPTLDGDEFAGKPTTGTQTFVEDTDLSDDILAKIQSGNVIEVKGDAATEITLILFPAA